MKKINIGIIGCGRISKKHFDALEKLEDYFNIVSICDNNTKKLLKINKLVEKYDNLDKMLDRDDLDIVFEHLDMIENKPVVRGRDPKLQKKVDELRDRKKE